MTSSSLFHSSGLWYQSGDRIPAGNWGRVILGAGPPHQRFYPEQVIDLFRRLEFPDKPSRMGTAFAFENRDIAASDWRRQQEHVYLVEVADPTAPSHRGDMAWIDAMPGQHSFQAVEACARSYWAGEPHPDGRWEVATESDLVVVERIG